MDFGFEYNQDIVIEGKTYVLDHVDNYIENGERVICRRFLSADGKDRKFFYKRFPLPQPKQVQAAAPAKAPEKPSETATTHTGLDSAALDAPETGKKPGLLKKVFGRKKKG